MPTATYTARPLLEIDGIPAPDRLMEDILEISVEESLHRPAMFTIVLLNAYFPGRDSDRPWQHDQLLRLGQTVRIGFQASTTVAPEFADPRHGYILEGEITGIESHFSPESQAPIVIRGYDRSHRLHRGRHNRSFQDYTDSDIVAEIASEVGIEVAQLDLSGSPNAYVFQENQTNMEFLRQRAARIGFELFVQDNKLYFRKPAAARTLQLKWLRDIHRFSVRMTTAEQVSGVEVRGWDYAQKQTIVATAQSESVLTETEHGRGSSTSSQFGFYRAGAAPKMVVVDQPVFQVKEAQAIAQSLCDELGGEFVQADATGEGDPRIRVGCRVELQEMGKYSGKYYLTETRHLFSRGRYTTEFSVRGLRGGNLLETLTPKTNLKPGQTFLAGIVTNNQDPQGMGRVRVKFPTLTPEMDGSAHESNWARIVNPGAGNGRGFDCLPEINDEVLVGFEHGDIHRPYVLGNVWNGRDKPPELVENAVQQGKVRLRTLKTRTGHQLQFVEEDQNASKAGIYVQTAGGHHLRINDSDRILEIQTTGGHVLRFDDRHQNIELRSAAGHTIHLDDRTRSVTVRSTGNLSLHATSTIDIQAGSAVNIRGAVINLN